ncbi:hypothetical protein OROGR_031213 [Orobanche gracilis]
MFLSTLEILQKGRSFRDDVFLLHDRRQIAKWAIICRVPNTYPSTNSK